MSTISAMAASVDWMPALQHMHQLLCKIDDPHANPSMCVFLQKNWLIMVAMDDIRAAAKTAMEATCTHPDTHPAIAAQARMVLWIIEQIEAME